uniref:Putative membrane protein n=1 Tax=uncultured bacterium Contig12 TaxID=1393397 RepID=W0FIS6_9BACT|nr:putative membrane protein [uncultured bacterium Contig12]
MDDSSFRRELFFLHFVTLSRQTPQGAHDLSGGGDGPCGAGKSPASAGIRTGTSEGGGFLDTLSKLSSPTMYLICGGIVLFVAVICVVFAVRAWRAGKAIGMDTAVLKRVVTSSASFSVLPAVGILLGVIALSGALGTPWPWLRLSVIGALHYETQVAEGAAEQVGIHLSGSEMTAGAFSTIALLMSVCIMWGMVLNLFLNKRYTRRLAQPAKHSDVTSFGDEAMTAMFIGLVSAYLGSYLGQWISGNGVFTLPETQYRCVRFCARRP